MANLCYVQFRQHGQLKLSYLGPNKQNFIRTTPFIFESIEEAKECMEKYSIYPNRYSDIKIVIVKDFNKMKGVPHGRKISKL